MSKIPFSLESIRNRKNEKHLIPVTEELLLVTNEIEPKHPEDLPTVEKIYNALTVDAQGGVGLIFPKKYGVTVAEDESVRELAGERDKVILEMRDMMEELAKEENVSFKEAQEFIFNPWGHQDKPGVYQRTPKIIKLIQKLNASDTKKAEVTVFMQTRSGAVDWHEFDTLALNISLFDAIYEYIEKDKDGWKQEVEVVENLGELPQSNLESDPNNSEEASLTPVLAGTKST